MVLFPSYLEFLDPVPRERSEAERLHKCAGVFLAWALFIVLPAGQKRRNLAFNIKWRQPNPPVLSETKIQTLITKQQGEKRLEVSRYFFMTTKSFVFYSGLFCIASETAVSTGFSPSHTIYKQWLPSSSETFLNFGSFSAGIQRE